LYEVMVQASYFQYINFYIRGPPADLLKLNHTSHMDNMSGNKLVMLAFVYSFSKVLNKYNKFLMPS
jgi:hypothetical protein